MPRHRISEEVLAAAREALEAGATNVAAAEAAGISDFAIRTYQKAGKLPERGENVKAVRKAKLPPLKEGQKLDGTPERVDGLLRRPAPRNDRDAGTENRGTDCRAPAGLAMTGEPGMKADHRAPAGIATAEETEGEKKEEPKEEEEAEKMMEIMPAEEAEREVMDAVTKNDEKEEVPRQSKQALLDINRAIEDMYRLQTGPMDEMNGVDDARRDELLPEFYELAMHLENIRARVFAEYVDWTKVYENMG